MATESENVGIVRPPKIFLDTNHFINIAKVRRGEPLPKGQSADSYLFINQCIAQHFGVVFLEVATLDWVDGKAAENSAREIADVLDSAKLLYLFESDTYVYLREVLDECVRVKSELHVPRFDICHLVSDGGSYEPALLKIAQCAPDAVPERAQASIMKLVETGVTEIPIKPVRDHVLQALLWKRTNPDTYKERIKGFKEMVSEDIEGKKDYFADPAYFHAQWLKRFLKADKVLAACNNDLSAEDVDDMLTHLDLQHCPSVWLYIEAHKHRMKAGHPPKDNDVDDWSILPVVPYVDVTLVDHGFREFIIQADRDLESKVFADATDAAEASSAFRGIPRPP
jgi:hypothetical protein